MDQLDKWKGSWGDAYTERNLLTAEDQLPLFKNILSALELDTILEVGCGSGHNLQALAQLFPDAGLFGVEPNQEAAIGAAQGTACISSQMTAYDLGWFPDKTIDLVFTTGVLIHIPPKRLLDAMTEIVRVSRKYVLAIEYFSPIPVAIDYRGEKGMLWKANFGTIYMENFPLYQVSSGNVTHLGEELTWWLMTR